MQGWTHWSAPLQHPCVHTRFELRADVTSLVYISHVSHHRPPVACTQLSSLASLLLSAKSAAEEVCSGCLLQPVVGGDVKYDLSCNTRKSKLSALQLKESKREKTTRLDSASCYVCAGKRSARGRWKPGCVASVWMDPKRRLQLLLQHYYCTQAKLAETCHILALLTHCFRFSLALFSFRSFSDSSRLPLHSWPPIDDGDAVRLHVTRGQQYKQGVAKQRIQSAMQEGSTPAARPQALAQGPAPGGSDSALRHLLREQE